MAAEATSNVGDQFFSFWMHIDYCVGDHIYLELQPKLKKLRSRSEMCYFVYDTVDVHCLGILKSLFSPHNNLYE